MAAVLVIAATVTAYNSRPFALPRCLSLRTCVRLCDEQLDSSSGLYESLRKRRLLLSARQDAATRERELISGLAEAWPAHERAQAGLWQHWFAEEGEVARDALQRAEGNAPVLTELMDEFPDWAEPANRLATLRYMEGDFEESVQLCLRVLRMKPWHFGAASGIVMCYARLAEASPEQRSSNVAEAKRWAADAMPQPGPPRNEWVRRMLALMDTKLAELVEISAD